MANSWFRMYAEIRRDPKVRTMPETFQLKLIWLFTLRCDGPTENLTREQLCYGLECDETFLETLHETFVKRGFIDEDWTICNWNKRQYVSDSSTPRVKKYRQKQGVKQDETFQKRYMKHAETQNETDQNRTEHKPIARKCSISLPEWIPKNIWFDYEDMRKKKRAPMTDPIRFRIVQRLGEFKEQGHDPVLILEESIRKSWTDVFKPTGGSNGKSSRNEQALADFNAELDLDAANWPSAH